jgi:Tfp pilus assembly protein PilO
MTKIAIIYKILSFIFFIVIFSLAYRFTLHQQYSTYLDTHLASRGLKLNLENLKKDFNEKESYAVLYAQTQETFNTLMIGVPSAKNFSTALNTVKTAGANARLQFQVMASATPVQKDFYTEVPTQITLVGTYQQLLDFMQMTAAWKGPFFIWKDWTLSHQFKPKTTVLNETTNNDLLKMDVNAVFFYTP